jgi:hypothetical protein
MKQAPLGAGPHNFKQKPPKKRKHRGNAQQSNETAALLNARRTATGQ